jgi:hypothetical protein
MKAGILLCTEIDAKKQQLAVNKRQKNIVKNDPKN